MTEEYYKKQYLKYKRKYLKIAGLVTPSARVTVTDMASDLGIPMPNTLSKQSSGCK
tara:strand:- start:6159 stop:6326 length:168 start_codon:yes stop_codon:yes gene_type:complete